NKKYVYANYGLDDDEIDLLEMLYYFRLKCGTYDSMQRWLDLASSCQDDSVYEQIRQLVDIDEYCNYMAVQLYLCNSDWPHNNLKVWRPITEGGKFRHILYDIDHAFKTTTPFAHLADVSYHYNSPSYTCEEVSLFFDMLKNESFRKQFIDTFCLVAGSVFEPTRCKDIITELCDRVEASQLLDTEVYTGINVTPWTTGNTLISKLTSSYQAMMIDTLQGYPPMGLSSVTAQSVELSSNISEARLLVNGLQVPTNYFNGKLFPPVSFKAEAPAGYKFLGWKRGDTYVSTSEEYEMPTSSGSMSLQACFREEGIAAAPVVINEVSAGNSVNVNEYFKKDDWVELYNTTDQDIDLEGMYITDTSKKPQKFQITAKGSKASTIIPAHGFKVVWCSGRETNTELHTSFKLSNADGELVRIEAEDGSWADSLVYCAMNGDESVGRYPDGGSDIYLMTSPTIKASNRMNSYTTLWDGTGTTGEEEQNLASRSGGMSIACVGDWLLLKDEDCDAVSLGVHTVSGVTVILDDVTLEGGHARLDISSLPSGVYIASARDKEGNQCATKFIRK
ncbi:MAG: CotH kinase family protein, partial [Prevotellaceae bacterium]|nr:CotH kinase family protein [Prevotellaceae bacterium]